MPYESHIIIQSFIKLISLLHSGQRIRGISTDVLYKWRFTYLLTWLKKFNLDFLMLVYQLNRTNFTAYHSILQKDSFAQKTLLNLI